MADGEFVAGGVWFEQCDDPAPHEQHRLPDRGNTWCEGVRFVHLLVDVDGYAQLACGPGSRGLVDGTWDEPFVDCPACRVTSHMSSALDVPIGLLRSGVPRG